MTVHDFVAYRELWVAGIAAIEKVNNEQVKTTMLKQLREYEKAVASSDIKSLIEIFRHIYITGDDKGMKFLNAVQQQAKQVTFRSN
jgi:hypothetical protein